MKTELSGLATEGWDCDNWARWFMTFEYFSRMGIVKDIPELLRQAVQLGDMLEEGNGFFPLDLKQEYFNLWGANLGLSLENGWKQREAAYDLTFRAIFILYAAGLLK